MITMIIEDNNPNMIPMIVLILAVLYIIFSLIEVKIKKKRKERLENTKKIINKNHERIIFDSQSKEREK